MIADGKKIAKEMEEKLAEMLGRIPQKRVCFVLFADDAGSRQFIALKSKVAQRVGIAVDVVERTDVVTTEDCLRVLADVVSKKYDGIVVQLPLPQGVDTDAVLNAIPESADLDVLGEEIKQKYRSASQDGVSVTNDLPIKTPPVAAAVWEILKYYDVDLVGKEILIIGNGRLVGEPVAMKLAHVHLPYKIIDSKTPGSERLASIASADVIISGVGSSCMIKPNMIKQGVILIDAGTSEQAGKLAGDIDPACAVKASLITPVPGGVGPVTVVCLFANLLQ